MSRYNENAYVAKDWDLWREATEFPKIKAKTDVTITLTLGEMGFGYVVGQYSRSYTGTVLNLTGATVKVYAQKLSSQPDLIEEVRGYSWIGEGRLFEKTATLTTPASGICTVALTPTDTDGEGRYLAEIEVTTSAGKKYVPGQFRLYLLKSVADR